MVTRALISALSIVVFLTLAITDSTMVGAANDKDLEVITASNAHRIERLRTIGFYNTPPSDNPVDSAVYNTDILFSPNNKLIAVFTRWTDALEIYGVESGVEIAVFKLGGIYSATFSPDSTKIAVVDTDDRLSVWDIATGKFLWIDTSVTSKVVFNTVGTIIAGGNINETVWLWDVKTGKRIASLVGKQTDEVDLSFHEQERIHDIVFSPNGEQVVATSYRISANPQYEPASAVLLWDLMSYQLAQELRGDEYTLSWWADFDLSGELIVISSSKLKSDEHIYPKGKIISFWDMRQSRIYASSDNPKSAILDINEVIFSTTKKFVIPEMLHSHLWEIKTGKSLLLEELSGPVITFNYDDTLLMTMCELIGIPSGKNVAKTLEKALCYLEGASGMVDATFSPDGTLLAFLMANNRVQLWGVRQDN